MRKSNIIFAIFFIFIFAVAVFLFLPGEESNFSLENSDGFKIYENVNKGGVTETWPEKNIENEIVIEKGAEDSIKDIATEDIEKIEEKTGDGALKIIYEVPFTPQAPYGEWDEPYFQDGCEEAASLMTVYWALGKELSPDKAKEKIIAASEYEIEKIGEFMDASMEDTLEIIIKGYFGYEKAELKNNISLNDIILELINGNLVIVHTNGQLLGNPYYTPPGPDRHSVVIIGYDEERGEFITNDSGTKRGAGFRYDKGVLFNAIRDYPTGHHEPISESQKNMIIVSRE